MMIWKKHEADLKAKNEADEAEEMATKKAAMKAKRAITWRVISMEIEVKKEAELKVKNEAEEMASKKAEIKAKKEMVIKAKHEAKLMAKKLAEERAMKKAEMKAKEEVEEKARYEAELKARYEAELKAKNEAEEVYKKKVEAWKTSLGFRVKNREWSDTYPENRSQQNSIEPMDVLKPEDIKTVATKENVSDYRKIVIDGLNICHEYSKHLIGIPYIKFSAEGLNVVYEHLKKMGYKDEKIVIIMKQIPRRYESERRIAQKLEDKNVLHYAPSRRLGQGYIQSDDDLFILKTAKILNAIVLSNDQFQKEKINHPEYSDVIDNCVIQPRFISGKLILPDDPLGKNGPKLEEFLRLPSKFKSS